MSDLSNPVPLAIILTATRMLAEVRVRAEERAQAAHGRFNVFTTLLKADDEVRLHTRFLHALLDPRGLHDCGTLFLKLFFATLAANPGLDHDDEPVEWQPPQAGEEWTVEKETGRSSGHGQLDLLLMHPCFAIAIENKIHAREQESQLGSYGHFLKQRRGEAVHLIYLTKEGKKSFSHDGQPYMRISYVEHILPWLEACLRETYRIIPINQVLLQYREVVRQITGQISEDSNMKPVIDFVTHNPAIIRFRQQLSVAVDEAKALFLDRLAEGILANLRRDYQPRLREDLNKGRFGLDLCGDIFIDVPDGNPLCEAPFEICVEHDTEWEALLIGVWIDDEKRSLAETEKAVIKQMHQAITEYSMSHSYHQETATEHWPLGWHNLLEELDDEGFAALMEKPLQPLVDEICLQIREYVRLLERFYVDAVSAKKPPENAAPR